MANEPVDAGSINTGWPRPCPECNEPTDHLVNNLCQRCYDQESRRQVVVGWWCNRELRRHPEALRALADWPVE